MQSEVSKILLWRSIQWESLSISMARTNGICCFKEAQLLHLPLNLNLLNKKLLKKVF
jgi:hypothetical protein